MHTLLAFLATTCLCALALYVHTRVRGFLPEDSPAPGRKRHARPTPMLGAAPTAVTVGLAALQSDWGLAVGLVLVGTTGLFDDLLKARDGGGIRARTKAVGQLLAITAVLFEPALAGATPWSLGLAALFLFVVTNAVNFLDNQNGVATALGVVGIGCAATGSWSLDAPTTWVAAAWLGFLPWNWPRARAFLGDQGALALGLAVGTASLRAPSGALDAVPDWRWLVPAAVPLLDFTQVVSARLYLGYAPWIGDRRHLTHVLLALGIPSPVLAPLLAGLAAAATFAAHALTAA